MAIKLQSRDVYAIMHKEHPDWPEGLDSNMRLHAYNALDSAVTLRVHHALKPKLAASPHAALSYQFVRAMQGPALDMMRLGVAINPQVRLDETERYTKIRQEAQARLDTLADAIWGPEEFEVVTKCTETYTPIGKRGTPLAARTRVVKSSRTATRPRGLNPNSNPQLLSFFNIALKCEQMWEVRKGPQGKTRTPSANDKALRQWAKWKTKGPGVEPRDPRFTHVNFAAPFVSLILTIRDADKMLSVLKSALGPDGRMRCSYNVAGTENGRWSSSANAFHLGTNLQNISPPMRRMFCADDGHYFCSNDLEQAESRLVAGLVWQTTGDDTYWLACESGDLHTTVCRMSWPELEWTDDPKANRRIADRTYPGLNGRFSYRDVAKRIGHGSNYFGTPYGIAQAIGIPVRVVEDFQGRYFKAFVSIPQWHGWVREQLRAVQRLDTPLGRRRWFFGRPNEDQTLREAIAYGPQSTIGELLNLALLRCWRRAKLPKSDPRHLPIQLLLQNHDAFAFQTPETADLPSTLAAIKAELEIPIPFTHDNLTRYMTIPAEFVVGWNWAYKDKGSDPKSWAFKDGNPDGLAKWQGREARTRVQGARPRAGDWLDRPLSRIW